MTISFNKAFLIVLLGMASCFNALALMLWYGNPLLWLLISATFPFLGAMVVMYGEPANVTS